MSTIIQSAGKSIAIGLSWSPLRGHSSERKEIAEIAKASNTKYGLVFRTDKDTLVGIYHDRYQRGLIAGAAWLAQTAGLQQDIIFIEPVSDGQVWFCAIRSGAPLQDQDCVIPDTEVYERIETLREQTSSYTVYARDGFIANSTSADLETLTSLAADASGKALPVIKQIQGLNMALVGAVLAAVLVIGGYFGFTTSRQHQQMIDAANEAEMNQVKDTQEQAAEWAKAQKDAEDKMDQVLAAAVTRQPTYAAAVTGWFNAVGNVPQSLVGWTLTGFDCMSAVCAVTYERQKISTIDLFTQRASQAGYKIHKIEGNVAVLEFDAMVTNRSLTAASLPDTASFLGHFQSQFQRMELAGLKFKITEPVKSTEKTVAVRGHPVETRTSAWSVGQFNLEGTYLFEARDSIDYVNEFRNIAATSMSLDFKKNTWMIKGNYALN